MKKELRKALLKQREEMSKAEVRQKSEIICRRLSEMLEDYKTVMVYIPNGNEVDIYPLIRQLLAAGKKIAAPICVERGTMIPSLISDLEKDLAPGRYDILAPKEERKVDFAAIEAVVVPGVGFDRRGNRLGFGAGYYDRFLPALSEKAAKIAICYDFQIIENLKVEPWDFPVDIVVSESNVYCPK